MSKRREQAFTLIELLVVIAIIGMLLAIMTPALKRAKEHMKFLVCKTNLKGFGTATVVYLASNDDTYPRCHTSVFNGDASVAGNPNYDPSLPQVPLNCQWHDARISPDVNPGFAGPLWPYVESMKACMCPTFKPFALTYGADHAGHQDSIPIEPQYAYSQNGFLGRTGTDGHVYGALKGSEVVDTAGTLVWVEETIWTIPGLTNYVLNDTCFFTRHPKGGFSSDAVTNLGDCIATYHNTILQKRDEGVGNAVFADGHVQLCDPRDKVVMSWGEISGSFRVAWPKNGKFGENCPY